MSQERADPSLTMACWWVTCSRSPSVLGQLCLESSCPSPGKGCLCWKAAPHVLSAHHPALSLLDVWLDLLLGLLGTEPSSLLLEPEVEHRVYLCAVCAWVENACLCTDELEGGWCYMTVTEWTCRSDWRDCGCVTPHTSPIVNSHQCSRVHMHGCWSQIPGFKSYLYLVWPLTNYLPF